MPDLTTQGVGRTVANAAAQAAQNVKATLGLGMTEKDKVQCKPFTQKLSFFTTIDHNLRFPTYYAATQPICPSGQFQHIYDDCNRVWHVMGLLIKRTIPNVEAAAVRSPLSMIR